MLSLLVFLGIACVAIISLSLLSIVVTVLILPLAWLRVPLVVNRLIALGIGGLFLTTVMAGSVGEFASEHPGMTIAFMLIGSWLTLIVPFGWSSDAQRRAMETGDRQLYLALRFDVFIWLACLLAFIAFLNTDSTLENKVWEMAGGAIKWLIDLPIIGWVVVGLGILYGLHVTFIGLAFLVATVIGAVIAARDTIFTRKEKELSADMDDEEEIDDE